MSYDIVITNLDIIEPYYDFVKSDIIIEDKNKDILVPLKLWFNQNYSLASPIIYIPYNEIKINFSFTPIGELYSLREL